MIQKVCFYKRSDFSQKNIALFKSAAKVNLKLKQTWTISELRKKLIFTLSISNVDYLRAVRNMKTNHFRFLCSAAM